MNDYDKSPDFGVAILNLEPQKNLAFKVLNAIHTMGIAKLK
jgi:hypothetical protein